MKVVAAFILLVIGRTYSSKPIIHLGGLFPLSPASSWYAALGNATLTSALYAIETINDAPDVLQDFEIKMDYNDTQLSSGKSMDIVYDYLYNSPPKLAIVGALFSGPTLYTAEASSMWNVIQVSYSATSPEFSNRKKFPYFFRTISSGNDFTPVRLELMRQFGWNKVATLSFSYAPFSDITQGLLRALRDANFTIVAAETVASSADLRTPLENLKVRDARVILGNFYESDAKRVFCEAYKSQMYGPKYVWLVDGYYTPGWYKSTVKPAVTCTDSEMLEAIDGYMTIVWSMMNPNDLEVAVGNITVKDYREEMFRRLGKNIFVPGHQIPATMAYDAVWAVALALNNSINDLKPRTLMDFQYRDKNFSDVIFKHFEKLQFTGVSGPVSFTGKGDRDGIIVIEQFKSSEQLERTIGLHRTNSVPPIEWLEGNAQIWFRTGGKPPPDADDTTVLLDILKILPAIFYLYSTFAGIGICIAIGFFVFNIVFMKLRVIKMSSPNLNNIILLGCVIAYVAVVVQGIDHQMAGLLVFRQICQASAWVLSCAFTLAFGAMFSKTWRVYSIFTNKSVKRKAIKDWNLFVIVAVLLLIDLVILLAWQLVDPLRVVVVTLSEHRNDEQKTVTKKTLMTCQSNNATYWTLGIYTWKGLLLLFGIFITWQTRNVSIPGLNDSKFIGMAIYNVVIFSAIGAPLSHVLSNDPNSQYAIIGGFILFCTGTVLCLVFVPKIRAVIQGDTGQAEKAAAVPGTASGETSGSQSQKPIIKSAKVAPSGDGGVEGIPEENIREQENT